MAFSVRQVFKFISMLFVIFLVSCQGKSSLRETFHLTNSTKADSLEVQRLMALAQKSLLTDYTLGIKQAIQASELAEQTPYAPLIFDTYK